MKVSAEIVSKEPPGGRCEFYANLFLRIVKDFENVTFSLIPASLYDGKVIPPAVLVNGKLIEPEDGILLTPQEILSALLSSGAKPRRSVEDVESELSEFYEKFLGG